MSKPSVSPLSLSTGIVHSRVHADYLANRWALDQGEPFAVVLIRAGFAIVRIGDPMPDGTSVYCALPEMADYWLERRPFLTTLYGAPQASVVDHDAGVA